MAAAPPTLRRPRCPDALVLILGLAALALVATWILPAGEFTREEVGGRMRVVRGTYHAVAAAPLPQPTGARR